MAEVSDAVLCYVSGDWAYFTTQPLSKQWGDDWDDAPYEHNAEAPYTPHAKSQGQWDIVKVAFEVMLAQPNEDEYMERVLNSRYSVQDINDKRIAWLRPSVFSKEGSQPIYAGDTLREFIDKIHLAGGEVYRKEHRGESEKHQ